MSLWGDWRRPRETLFKLACVSTRFWRKYIWNISQKFRPLITLVPFWLQTKNFDEIWCFDALHLDIWWWFNLILDPYGTAGRQAQLLSKVTPFYRAMFCKLGAKEWNIKANELHVCTPADKLVRHCELLCSAVLQAERTQCRLSNQFTFIAQEPNSKHLTHYISQKTRPWNLQLS